MKSITSTFVAILLATTCFAQNKFQAETFLGINGGITSSKIDFIPIVVQDKLSGINGGLTYRYISENYFGLQVELNYSQRGWKESSTDLTQTYTRQLSYIELPFLTHLYFGKKSFRYFINLGPKIAYLINESETNTYTSSATERATKVQHPVDYGICAGSGFELRTKAGCFLIEGRYNFGLSDIFYNSKADPFTRSSNQVISANVTYLVKL